MYFNDNLQTSVLMNKCKPVEEVGITKDFFVRSEEIAFFRDNLEEKLPYNRGRGEKLDDPFYFVQ